VPVGGGQHLVIEPRSPVLDRQHHAIASPEALLGANCSKLNTSVRSRTETDRSDIL